MLNLAVFVFDTQSLVSELARDSLTTPVRVSRLIAVGILLTFLLVAAIPAPATALVGLDNPSEVTILSWGRSLNRWVYYVANISTLLAVPILY